MVKLYDTILEDHKACEIMEDVGMDSENDAAMYYFRSIIECDPDNWNEDEKPTFSEFVGIIYGNWELYHDYGAGYYFAIKD